MTAQEAIKKLETGLAVLHSLPDSISVLGVSIFGGNLHFNVSAGRLPMEQLAREAGVELVDQKTPFGFNYRLIKLSDGTEIRDSYNPSITERGVDYE